MAARACACTRRSRRSSAAANVRENAGARRQRAEANSKARANTKAKSEHMGEWAGHLGQRGQRVHVLAPCGT